jgi:hypothetical protein
LFLSSFQAGGNFHKQYVEAIEEAVRLARMPVEARAAYMAEMLKPV